MTRTLLLLAATTLAAPALASDLRVFSYASQVNDVDAVNSHWFETGAGTVLIDAQRLLPEAERALQHLRATTDEPVVAIVVSHAHTDHYGGLPVWLDAFPEAQVITDSTTLGSILEDGRGFIAARGELHGERFATQVMLTQAVADARVIEAGEEVAIGDATLAFDVLGPSEAESTVVTEVVGRGTAFVGDLINIGIPAVPFEDLDAWLDQLDGFEARFEEGDRLHIGHGPSPASVADVPEQRRYLTTLRGLVAGALEGDGVLDAAETDAIVFALEAGWPFHEGVAGQTRREVGAFSAGRVAGQLGGRVEASEG